MERERGYAICGAGEGCEAQFKGRQSHCTICHQTFASECGGDDHRVGPYEPAGQRRCRSEAELLEHGFWVTSNKTGTRVLHGRWSKKGRSHRQAWWAAR